MCCYWAREKMAEKNQTAINTPIQKNASSQHKAEETIKCKHQFLITFILMELGLSKDFPMCLSLNGTDNLQCFLELGTLILQLLGQTSHNKIMN